MPDTSKTSPSVVEANKEISLLANIEGIARAMFQVSDEDVLLLRNIFDSKGQIKLYHPVVQSAILKLIKTEAAAELTKIEAEQEAKEEKARRKKSES